MPKGLSTIKRLGTAIMVPLVFLILGYGLLFVIGRPVIQFTTSSLQLFLLTDVPVYAKQQETNANLQENQVTLADDQAAEAKSLASSQIKYPKGGEQYGQIEVPGIKLEVPLFYGDTDEILRVGAGQYMGSVYPGEKGTSLIGGHNVYGLGKMIALEKGMDISIKTTYANYQYQVTDSMVKHKDDQEIYQMLLQKEKPLLILYTCYPVDAIGLTDERLFVIAELSKGPLIDETR